jgi:hypothetical protein
MTLKCQVCRILHQSTVVSVKKIKSDTLFHRPKSTSLLWSAPGVSKNSRSILNRKFRGINIKCVSLAWKKWRLKSAFWSKKNNGRTKYQVEEIWDDHLTRAWRPCSAHSRLNSQYAHRNRTPPSMWTGVCCPPPPKRLSMLLPNAVVASVMPSKNYAIPSCLGYYPDFEFDLTKRTDWCLIQRKLLSQNKQSDVPIPLQVILVFSDLLLWIIFFSCLILVSNRAAV